MKREGVLSIWLGTAQPDIDAIDIFYESHGIGPDVLGDGKDENCFNSEGRDIEDIIQLVPFSSSFAGDVVAAARQLRLDVPAWISILYDYAHNPANLDREVPNEPTFLGVFDYSAQD